MSSDYVCNLKKKFTIILTSKNQPEARVEARRWLVTVGAAGCHAFGGGAVACVGVLITDARDRLNTAAAETAVVAAFALAFFCFVSRC